MDATATTLPSKNGTYVLHKQLFGHHGAILVLSPNKEAALLASGGRDGTRIFSLAEFVQKSRPIGPSNRGATTAMSWAEMHDHPSAVLLFGTENGVMAIWAKNPTDDTVFEEICVHQVAKKSEITSIAFEKQSRRVGLTNRDGLVQVHLLESHGVLEMVFSVETTQFMPKSIMFMTTMTHGDKDVLVAGQECGNLYRLEGKSGMTKDVLETGTKIGGAVISNSGILYDDPFHGAILLAFDGNRLRKRGFEIAEIAEATKCPRQSVFSDGDTKIVTGTNSGKVVVFERATDNVIDEMPTGMGATQTVATMSAGQEEFIFGANAREVDTANPIFVWARAQAPVPSEEPVGKGSGQWITFDHVFRLAALGAGLWVCQAVLEVLKEQSRSKE